MSDKPTQRSIEVFSQEENARRCVLIDKEIVGTISSDEKRELDELQRRAEDYFDEIAGPQLEEAERLIDHLEESQKTKEVDH